MAAYSFDPFKHLPRSTPGRCFAPKPLSMCDPRGHEASQRDLDAWRDDFVRAPLRPRMRISPDEREVGRDRLSRGVTWPSRSAFHRPGELCAPLLFELASDHTTQQLTHDSGDRTGVHEDGGCRWR